MQGPELPHLAELHLFILSPRKKTRSKPFRVFKRLVDRLLQVNPRPALLVDLVRRLFLWQAGDLIRIFIVIGSPPAANHQTPVSHLHQVEHADQKSSRSHPASSAGDPVMHRSIVAPVEDHFTSPACPHLARKGNEGPHLTQVDSQDALSVNLLGFQHPLNPGLQMFNFLSASKAMSPIDRAQHRRRSIGGHKYRRFKAIAR